MSANCLVTLHMAMVDPKRRATFILYLALVSQLLQSLPAAAPPSSPDYELHPALEMSLWAKEPDVFDPVALTWDEDGRMYVVEMRDYPYGFGPDRKPGGSIRLLEDVDGNGQCDRSRLFAEGLSFPTSVVPWNSGILVAAPPEVLYLKDTNGDGKADMREVILKGFVLGVTDSNMNGLRWGLDNRVHGVNGGNGGTIVSPRKPGSPLPFRNLDFSFDPKTGHFTPTYHTSAGFGLVFDEWGRSFVTYNINHIQQRMILVRYLHRFPGGPPTDAIESISDHGDMARIYPISEPETRVNHPEQSGHFSSAGGLGYIAWRGYPGDLFGSILVCDVVGNLVHRDVLSPHGPGFIASRSARERQSEFFASRDRAFRPIGVELGPDGALYLVDMQRAVIEHPDYIPQKVRDKLDIRAGDDRGRIYRITPKGGLPPRRPNLRRADAAELAGYLRHPNPWMRYTAQRLLIERRDRRSLPALKKLALNTKDPLGRVHSLWALHGLGALDEQLVLRALSAPEPGLRENALQLSEYFLGSSKSLRESVLKLGADPAPRVRFQAALTLGQFDHPNSSAALLTILMQDYPWRWTRLAALSSIRGAEDKLLRSLLTEPGFRNQMTTNKLELVGELADLIGARAAANGSSNFSAMLAFLAEQMLDAQWLSAALEGLHAGVLRAGSRVRTDAAAARALEQLSRESAPALFAAAWKLARALRLPETKPQQDAIAAASKRALDRSRPVESRIEEIQLLGLGSMAAVGPALVSLLDGREPSVVQRAALQVLAQFPEPAVAHGLLEHWRSLSPPLRPLAINLLLQRVSFHEVLLTAIETGQIQLGELALDLEQRRRLLWQSAPAIRARAGKWIADEEYSNRKAVVETWLKKLPIQGDATRGRALFEKACASCHALDGLGYQVGPDLAAVSHRSIEDLVSNILDPNMAIQPNYAAYTVETVSGEIQSGILSSESPGAVTILQALGIKTVVPRSQIKRLESSGLSLMPEGLEGGMAPADLRDLIQFLQQKR